MHLAGAHQESIWIADETFIHKESINDILQSSGSINKSFSSNNFKLKHKKKIVKRYKQISNNYKFRVKRSNKWSNESSNQGKLRLSSTINLGATEDNASFMPVQSSIQAGDAIIDFSNAK